MTLKKLTVMLLAATVSFGVFGCGSDSGNGSSVDDSENLNSPYGGYTASNEAPAFGDAELAAMMAADAPYDDPLYSASDIDSLPNPERTVYALMIRWGQLEGDSTNTALTDFSGSLELVRGEIAVRQLIRFEPGQDWIVRPRESRAELEWVSKTSVHYDGLLLLIVDPVIPPESLAIWTPNTLTFTNDFYSRTFTMEELASLELIVDVYQLGNQIAFNARRVDQIACGEGAIEGIWRLNPSGQNGEFFGRWFSADGVFHGHLKGHFGARPNGDKVFFGKAIGVDGHFAGLLRGVWGHDESDQTQGWFEGTWASNTGLAVGTLGGNWQSGFMTGEDDDDDDGEGPGHGRGNRGHDRHGRWGGGDFAGWYNRVCDSDSSPNPDPNLDPTGGGA